MSSKHGVQRAAESIQLVGNSINSPKSTVREDLITIEEETKEANHDSAVVPDGFQALDKTARIEPKDGPA